MSTPSRRNVVGLLLVLWQIAATAGRAFVWNSVVEGTIDLRPLSRGLRLLAVLAQALIVAFLLSILFTETLRVSGPLEPLAVEADEARGLLVPSAAVPLTMAALSLGWGYVLAGAVRVRWWLRWLTALLYLAFAVLPVASVQVGLIAAGVSSAWSLLAVPAVMLALALAPRRPARPALEWCAMTALNGLLFCGAVAGAAYAEQLSGGELRVSSIASRLALNGLLLITPFLLIAGLGWIDFGLELSAWTARAVRRHAAGWLAGGLLLALLAYRVVAQGAELLGEGGGPRRWPALLGAALFCGGLALIAWWRARQGEARDVPREVVYGLLLVPVLPQALLVAFVSIFSLAPLMDAFAPDAHRGLSWALGTTASLSEGFMQQRALLLGGIGAGVAWLALRRGHPSAAGYALILAWDQALRWLTASGRPLYALRFDYAMVDRLAMLALLAVALWWLARRALTAERSVRLLALVVLFGLLNQTDFLDNPFSPLFGFAGVFFLVFGIIWNLLDAGTFANRDTGLMPRSSRLMLYLGYVLISVSVAHWYLVSHNVGLQASQADLNASGFILFGLPLAYLALVEGGRALVDEER